MWLRIYSTDSNLQYDRWPQYVSWRKNLRCLFILPDSEVPGTGVLIEYGCWKTRFRANSKLNKKLLKPARRKCWGWCPWLIPRICGELEAGDFPCVSLSAWTHSLSWFLIQASHCLAKEKQKAQKQKENASHFSWKMRQLCKILTLKMEVYQFAAGLLRKSTKCPQLADVLVWASSGFPGWGCALHESAAEQGALGYRENSRARRAAAQSAFPRGRFLVIK